MKKFTEKINNKIWISVLGIVVVLLVFVFAIITPLYQDIDRLRVELDSSEKAVIDTETRVKNYQATVAEFRRIESGREKISDMFPIREEMVVLVQGLESAASSAGVSAALEIVDELENPTKKVAGAPVDSLPVSAVQGLVGITEVPFKLIFSSNYRDLVDFFLEFEHLPFVSSISKIAVTADTEQNELTETLINTGSGTTLVEGVFFIRSE